MAVFGGGETCLVADQALTLPDHLVRGLGAHILRQWMRKGRLKRLA
jgi:hypothetical protein